MIKNSWSRFYIYVFKNNKTLKIIHIKKHPALVRERGVLDLKAGDDLLSHG